MLLDALRTQEELAADRLWMANLLERERKQIQAEQALKDRQREEMRRWKESLERSSKAQEMVRFQHYYFFSQLYWIFLGYFDPNIVFFSQS